MKGCKVQPPHPKEIDGSFFEDIFKEKKTKTYDEPCKKYFIDYTHGHQQGKKNYPTDG